MRNLIRYEIRRVSVLGRVVTGELDKNVMKLGWFTTAHCILKLGTSGCDRFKQKLFYPKKYESQMFLRKKAFTIALTHSIEQGPS